MKNITDVMPESWRPVAKAVVAFVGAFVVTLIGALLLVVDPGETLADVTFRQWLVVAFTVFGGGAGGAAGAYGARNDDPKRA